MSADVLREAAALMRSRAEAVDTSPDESESIDEPWTWAEQIGFIVADPDATHLTTFGHPAVALVVADWLDALYDAMTNPDAPNSGTTTHREEDAAIAIATAYLNREATS